VREGRLRAAAQGLSQSPSQFQRASTTFCTILVRVLRELDFRGLVIAMYVDDSGQAAQTNMRFMVEVQNDLAAILGLIYKLSKDKVCVS
jgi:hypothetical protein